MPIGMGAILESTLRQVCAWLKRASRSYLRCRKNMGCHFGGSLAQLLRGCIFAATDRGDQATQLIVSGLSALAATRVTLLAPFGLTWLARAHAACGRSR